MNLRTTIKSIIFDDSTKPTKYLIIRRVKAGSDYWQFIGGGQEDNESNRDTIEREISEELGIDNFNIITELPFTSEGYKFQNDKYLKKIHFFLIKLSSLQPITLEKSHPEYRWCTKKETLNLLHYPQQKNDFKKATDIIKNKYNTN